MKAGMTMSKKTQMSLSDFLACLNAAVEGVKMRGKSVQGEKTMLDAMIPALEAMNKAIEQGLTSADVLKCGYGFVGRCPGNLPPPFVIKT